jgi:hypothetical protein
MGIDFFKKAIELQRKYARPGMRILNAFQTNGTLLQRRGAISGGPGLKNASTSALRPPCYPQLGRSGRLDPAVFHTKILTQNHSFNRGIRLELWWTWLERVGIRLALAQTSRVYPTPLTFKM